ncbi:anaerobic dimethyl sulfoxide reductase, A subunit, DmsA/YnfE family [Klebsiella pneumoniae]|nr:anaerobic dimethyl sulfoxide reductase, A subunit, DmsA/YnfE family [Klebsiella pneumoniae]
MRSNNSWMHNYHRLVKGKPRHQLLMHPRDLEGRGLVDGQRVRVRSRVGSVEVEVAASSEMMPGCNWRAPAPRPASAPTT